MKNGNIVIVNMIWGIDMKIAVTYKDGQVFQHFGHTEKIKVYEINSGKVVSAQILDTN